MSGTQLPKISLVTSCLDQLPMLRESMGSVLNQGYPGLEYILIDRGSSDGTREYLQEFKGLPVIFHEAPGLDRNAAINKGLAMASGSIMGWLDVRDKHFHLGLFKVALVFLSDWKVNWVTGRQASWLAGDEYEENKFQIWKIKTLIQAYQGKPEGFPQPATFWKRALWDLVGAKLGPGSGDDAALDLWLRFYEHVELYSADALFAGYGPAETGVVENAACHKQQANGAVIQQNQDRIDKANRRSTSPNSLRCSINTRDFLRLLQETRPGYVEVDGLTLYRGQRKQRISPPLLICYGLPKSASSFTWKIACKIAGGEKLQQLTSRQLPEFLDNRFLQPVDKRSLAIVELLPPDITYVLKTHGPVSEAVQALVSAGLAKAVVSVRDPYDLVASLMDAGVSERARPPGEQRIAFTAIHTFEDALLFVLGSIDSCRGWLQFAQAHDFPVIHFEQVKNRPETIATRVADLLGVAVEPAAVIEPFLKNKTENIPEFNVGVSGRGRKLFDGYNNPEVSRVLDGFKNLISKFE